MRRIGLALSGGGFRATLFHLGMIRFLREANILPSVTHITSVSGGSILAAHLVLNWHRYTDSLKEFDAVAAELIRLVQLDVRNRVVRRYPLAMPLRALRRLAFRRPCRQLTRTGLLEYHYEKFLYGDTCLFQLPERPRLYILATNLSEGCLCAFTRDGLLMQRRLPGQRFRFDRIHTGLATVPMAVTASSAFPGFFAPLELHGQDVGADPGQFGRRAFTDGGVYDNLGVRMFRCLERSWMAREIRLERDDFADAEAANQALRAAAQAKEDTPLRRLAQMMDLPLKGKTQSVQSTDEAVNRLLEGLGGVMKHENLAREPVFAGLSPPDPAALPLLQAAQHNGGEIDSGEQLWLNRQLVEAAFRQATGKPCFCSLNACFDGVLVSDAGAQFKISAKTRAGGVIATAMRSTDIVMDRVWQLEIDTFAGTPGFVFAPISKVVEPAEDPTALHPEVQRMAADIRTDLDRFSPLEISSLIRHGYCVGRSVCRTRPDLFGTEIPTGTPWDPLAFEGEKTTRAIPTDTALRNAAAAPETEESPGRRLWSTLLDYRAWTRAKPTAPQFRSATAVPETEESRTLQQSAGRRLWSTLLDYRDWTSYIYVPLLVPILIVLPYYGVKWYRQAQVDQRLVESMAQSNRDYAVIRKLVQEGPSAPFEGMPAEEVRELTPPDYSGFEVIGDMRVADFRLWKASSGQATDQPSWYFYRRVRLQKLEATANRFVLLLRVQSTQVQLRSRIDHVSTTLRLLRDTAPQDGKPLHVYEITFDLSRIPVRDVVDLPMELLIREPRPEDLQSATFYVDTETGLLSTWLLMPGDRPIKSFSLLRHPTGKASSPESVAPAHQLILDDGQILAFTLLSTKPGFIYECRWTYPD